MLRRLQVIGTLAVFFSLQSAPIFAQTPAAGTAPATSGAAPAAHPHKKIGHKICNKLHSKHCASKKATAPAASTTAAPAK